MSFFKSIKSAFGGSEDEYDVFGQTTSFVNPFSKDKNVAEKSQHIEENVGIEVNEHEGDAITAEFADRATKLMNEHTMAVIDMIKGSWKKEREDLLKKVEEAQKMVDDSKEKMQVNEANRRQAQNRASDLTSKVAELEAQLEKMDIDKKSAESRLKAMEAKGDKSEELNGRIEELNSKNEELNGIIDDLKKQLAERDAEIERRDNLLAQAEDGPSVEQLNQQIEQRDELIARLRGNNTELQEQLGAANEDL